EGPRRYLRTSSPPRRASAPPPRWTSSPSCAGCSGSRSSSASPSPSPRTAARSTGGRSGSASASSSSSPSSSLRATTCRRRSLSCRTAGRAFGRPLLCAACVLKGNDRAAAFAPLGWPAAAFSFGASFFVVFLDWVEAGATFLFGALAVGPGADGSLGFFFAFQVLPTIVVFSSLMCILYYLGVMRRVLRAMAWVVSRALQTSGTESLSVPAHT